MEPCSIGSCLGCVDGYVMMALSPSSLLCRLALDLMDVRFDGLSYFWFLAWKASILEISWVEWFLWHYPQPWRIAMVVVKIDGRLVHDGEDCRMRCDFVISPSLVAWLRLRAPGVSNVLRLWWTAS